MMIYYDYDYHYLFKRGFRMMVRGETSHANCLLFRGFMMIYSYPSNKEFWDVGTPVGP